MHVKAGKFLGELFIFIKKDAIFLVSFMACSKLAFLKLCAESGYLQFGDTHYGRY